MDRKQYQLAKNIIKHELQALLQLHLDEITVIKFLYMFWTGVEVTDKNGKISKIYPLGPFVGWLIEIINKEESPYKKIPGYINPIAKMRFTGKHVSDLLQQAEYNSVAWDAAKELAVKIKAQNDELPKELNEFIYKALTSKGPKRKSGQHPVKKLHRNYCIIMLILEFERIGFLYPTKSSSDSDTLSLCDAVSEALHELEKSHSNKESKPIGYEAVKSIWDKREQFQKHLPGFRLDVSENGTVYVGYSIGRPS